MEPVSLGVGERHWIKKKRTIPRQAFVQTSTELHRYCRETGELLGVSDRKFNTLQAAGLDEMLALIVGTSSKHLDASNAGVAVSASGGAYTGPNVFLQTGTDAGPINSGTPNRGSPSDVFLWEFHDISATQRLTQNTLEFWYGTPTDTPTTEVHISTITVSEGTKPTTENWIWRVYMEIYSTDSDFTDGGLADLLERIAGVSNLHADATNFWMRPFTSSDTGLGASGQNPDGAPTVDTGANSITWVWTVAAGNYEGEWAKVEVSFSISAATYSGTTDLRYGGCKTDGTSCGTKGPGEEWEWTYVLTLAQGSAS